MALFALIRKNVIIAFDANPNGEKTLARTNCPNCDFELTLTLLAVDTIVECPNCFQELQITSLKPLKFKSLEQSSSDLVETDVEINDEGDESLVQSSTTYVKLDEKGLTYNLNLSVFTRLTHGAISRSGFVPLQHLSLLELVRRHTFPVLLAIAGLGVTFCARIDETTSPKSLE